VPRRLAVLFSALTLCLGALVAAGCGSSSNNSSSGSSGSSSTATPTAAGGKKIKVGLVTDIGGLNDRSFNQLAYQGLQQAGNRLGVTTRVLPSKSNADYVPNLSTLAQQKYDLVIGVGFLMADAMDTVASKFPNTKFAIIDVDQTTLKHKPSNVQGLLFKEQESGYLAGYLAGLYTHAKGGKQVIGSVGGQKIPPVDHYIAGYQAGAKASNPGIKTLNAYSQDFVDQAKCKELALNQIAEGAQVVFQVAGQCGLGVLDAAKEKGVQGIGVDADQSYIGPQVLTSAIKKVDVAVFDTIQAAQGGSFQGGGNKTFDLTNNATGLGKISAAGQKFAKSVAAQAVKIKHGSITPPDTVK
jgi:basic membrane protein A and related proteins